jgi:hypothetical protein
MYHRGHYVPPRNLNSTNESIISRINIPIVITMCTDAIQASTASIDPHEIRTELDSYADT